MASGDEHHGLTLLPKLPGAFDKSLRIDRTAFTGAWASRGSGPQIAHTAKVMMAIRMTAGTK